MSQEEYNRLLKLQEDYENGLIEAEQISTDDLMKLISILDVQIKKLQEELNN